MTQTQTFGPVPAPAASPELPSLKVVRIDLGNRCTFVRQANMHAGLSDLLGTACAVGTTVAPTITYMASSDDEFAQFEGKIYDTTPKQG